MEIGEPAARVATPRDGKGTSSPEEMTEGVVLRSARFDGSVFLDPRISDREAGDGVEEFSDEDEELYDTDTDSDIEFEEENDDDPPDDESAGISIDVTVVPVDFLGTKARSTTRRALRRRRQAPHRPLPRATPRLRRRPGELAPAGRRRPVRFAAQLQELYVEVTVSAGILLVRRRDRMAAEPRVRPSLRGVGVVVMSLPAPVTRRADEEDDAPPAKRRRLAGAGAEEEECAICFEVMETGLAAWPRCAHVFHGECLQRGSAMPVVQERTEWPWKSERLLP